ncbi:MAG TPA: response regulator [Opitutaceae bacterium]|nr:response regulator [Opitutaceae bacterium]
MINRWFRNLPIKRKLSAITLCAATAALFAALLTFLGVQVRVARDNAVSDLTALAQIVASNAAGPLVFDDREAGRTALQSLRARNDIERARLINAAGQVFGEVDFSSSPIKGFGTTADADSPAVTVRGSRVLVVQPVTHGGEKLGRLELLADVRGVLARLLTVGAGAMLIILACALGLAYALISRLQRAITTPLSSLASTAREIASKGDYSLRVERLSDDEVGELTGAFNHMLDQVDERDLALSGAKQQLAAQVTVLQHEIGERQRAEGELQRAKEAAETANRSKSAFLAAMSHEIRTPMNGVLATANLLLDSPLNDEQRELSNLIRVSGEGLLSILNDILDFSKIEAGRVELEQTNFDLRDLIEDAVELHAVSAASKGLDVASDLLGEMSTAVRGDPYRLRQVLMNLIGNAVKFTERGEVVVSVHAEPVVNGAATYRLEVRDSGIGMSAEAQAQLFKPFTQADSSTTRKFGGTGLGLAICKGLVELMGGEIGVTSEEGTGSTFWFTVPLQIQPGVSSVNPAPPSLRGRRLLVVDANAGNRQRLHRQLVSWSMECAQTSTAEEALTLVNSLGGKHSDCIAAALICLTPAEGAGLELARRLRAEPAWRNRPVILLSTQAERLAARSLAAEGVNACLYRPMRMRQLAATLERLLAPAGAVPAPKAAALQTVSGAPLRVLLVEDNPVNQRVGSLMLKKHGCEITVAGDGREALRRLAERSFELILMDCQMPQMDGFETTKRIREAESIGPWIDRGRQLIVAMTANAMEGDRERCLESGMDDYLPKPMRPEQLEAVLRKAREENEG